MGKAPNIPEADLMSFEAENLMRLTAPTSTAAHWAVKRTSQTRRAAYRRSRGAQIRSNSYIQGVSVTAKVCRAKGTRGSFNA